MLAIYSIGCILSLKQFVYRLIFEEKQKKEKEKRNIERL
jgi:hypothetical protein